VSTKSKEETEAEGQKLLIDMRTKQVHSWIGKTVMGLIEKHPTSPFIRAGILQKLKLYVPEEEKDIIGWILANYKW
jgi:hypothetical protein